MSYGHAGLLASRCDQCHTSPAPIFEDSRRLCTTCYKTRESIMHGHTRRTRRLAERYWLDLGGLDKRQQRRAVRREGKLDVGWTRYPNGLTYGARRSSKSYGTRTYLRPPPVVTPMSGWFQQMMEAERQTDLRMREELARYEAVGMSVLRHQDAFVVMTP